MPLGNVRIGMAVLMCMTSLGFARGDAGGSKGILPPRSTRDDDLSRSEAQPRLTVVVGGSTGLGISYLPLIVMKEERLLEKHAASYGIDVAMQWRPFPVAADMYDALSSGEIDFASGGVTQLLASWDRTRANLRVKGIGALNAMPLDLVTSIPGVTTIADFTLRDRIALPAVRTSIQAVVLSMAAEKAFGRERADELDPLTVPLGHPEAMAALLCGAADIDAHFSSPPFMYEELTSPGIHKVLDSYEVLGGPHTYNLVWATTKFHDADPKVVSAFVDALHEALDLIKADPAAVAAVWVRAGVAGDLSAVRAEEIIRKPEIEWTSTPRKVMDFAKFMNRTGLLTTKPVSWREVFFDNVTEAD